jgi:uncharacterized C2H2 Zn-finger protein
MPIVKAYAGNNSVVAVDTAKIIDAYRCPWTKEVFQYKSDYTKHLRYVRHNIHAKIRKQINDAKLIELSLQLSFENIISWIETNRAFFFNRLAAQDQRVKPDDYEKFYIKITKLVITRYDHISNSHYCPRGGVSNWTRSARLPNGDPAPTGYPGWQGDIDYKIAKLPGLASDAFRGIGIHTGSGGARGGNVFSYDVRLFDDDWPGVATLAKLSGNLATFTYVCKPPPLIS